MTHVDRVRRLLDLQGFDGVERALLDGEIVAYEPHQTGAAGINSTFYVEIEPNLTAFHKPHEGIIPRVARDYGHSLDTPPICECAAWQLAKNLGEPYDRLVAVTVFGAGPYGRRSCVMERGIARAQTRWGRVQGFRGHASRS